MCNRGDDLNVSTYYLHQEENPYGFFYKFKGFSNFGFFLDILSNKRLYAAHFGELNDPMEGIYQSQKELNNEAIGKQKKKKYEHRICSLTKDPTNPLMWAFYADNGFGCCIKLKLGDGMKPVKVSYDKTIQDLTNSNLDAEEILHHKLSQWGNEKEWRVITEGNKEFVPISINSIFLGLKISDEDFNLYKKIIHAIDSSIHVGKVSISQNGTYNLEADNN